jgi:hypothetical protein
MLASVLGCLIDSLTMADTVELARRAMRSQQRLQHVALNVAKLVNVPVDPVLAADVAGGDVISIDGMGIVWGARALGLPGQVTRDRHRSAHRDSCTLCKGGLQTVLSRSDSWRVATRPRAQFSTSIPRSRSSASETATLHASRRPTWSVKFDPAAPTAFEAIKLFRHDSPR